MSYDIFIFRRPETVSLVEINAFLRSDAYDEFLDELDAKLEDEGEGEDDEPVLPERLVDHSMLIDDLSRLAGKAYLLEARGAQEDPETAAYLDSDDWLVEPPAACTAKIDEFFEYGPTGGMLFLAFELSEATQRNLDLLTRALQRLKEWRVAVFEPQELIAYDSEAGRQEAMRGVIESERNKVVSGELFDPEDAFWQIGRLLEEFDRYSHAGMPDDAMKKIAQAWDLAQTFSDDDDDMAGLKRSIRESMGYAQYDIGNHEKCVEFLKDSMAMGNSPDESLQARMVLGMALHDLGRDEEAAEHLQVAYKIGGKRAFRNVAPELLKLGRK